MRTWKAAVAATAVALLALAAAPAAGAATDPPPDPKPAGRWMTCGDGRPVDDGRIAATRIVGDPQGGHHGFLQTRINIQPCVRPGRLDEFAYVMFSGPASRRGVFQTVRYLALKPGGTYTFTTQLMGTDLRAVCLSSRETRRVRTSHRLDCVRVDWSRSGQPPVLDQHIPPDDPLVRRTATFVFTTDPNCAGCGW